MKERGPLDKLIDQFVKMPSIGPKSAQRLAFYILSLPPGEAQQLVEAIKDVKEKVRYCRVCFFIADTDPCLICSDQNRRDDILCVVAHPREVMALERTGRYNGRYHVLGGLISPVEGLGPDHLRIKELLERLKNGKVKEVIIATNPTVEGETTMEFLSQAIQPMGIKITRLAYGLPVGADIDYADEMTLARSLEGRREVGESKSM